jgi:acetylornithine/N-succinyldiaminopimelate aminotransferase
MANGFPIGGILTSNKISDSMTVGSHGTTFGGGPIACAIGSRVVDIISKKAFLTKVLRKEKRLIKKLNEINLSYQCFNEISSAGLWISVELASIDVDDLIKLSHKNGLMVLKANATTIRFSPSLIIEDSLIDNGLEIFEKSILQLQ